MDLSFHDSSSGHSAHIVFTTKMTNSQLHVVIGRWCLEAKDTDLTGNSLPTPSGGLYLPKSALALWPQGWNLISFTRDERFHDSQVIRGHKFIEEVSIIN